LKHFFIINVFGLGELPYPTFQEIPIPSVWGVVDIFRNCTLIGEYLPV